MGVFDFSGLINFIFLARRSAQSLEVSLLALVLGIQRDMNLVRNFRIINLIIRFG